MRMLFRKRVVEEVRVLRHQRDAPAQLVQPVVAQIVSVQPDHAR